MTSCDLETSVPDWIIEHPETLAVFQRLGIDYCCGGKSLEYACREQGIDADAVLSALHRHLNSAGRHTTSGEADNGDSSREAGRSV